MKNAQPAGHDQWLRVGLHQYINQSLKGLPRSILTTSLLSMSPWQTCLNGSVLAFGTTQSAFLTLFTIVILLVPQHATIRRFTSQVALSALTYTLQETFFQLSNNPHWRAAAAPLFWIQFLSASEMLLVSRVDAAYFSASRRKSRSVTTAVQATQVVALLWNLRRVGTRWQVKTLFANPRSEPVSASRTRFVLTRLTTTLLVYLVVDIMVSGPSPDAALVSHEKETLIAPDSLSLEDFIFRIIGTVSFWLSTALINLLMSNTVAIFSVLVGLSAPTDCPPLYGSIGEAYSVRRFWGNSWHQCLRPGLTGHADLIADSVLPVARTHPLSRYTRLFLAFLTSGLIHHSSDLAMGIPRAEAGSLAFFVLQPLGIMLEDGMQTLARRVPALRSRGRVKRIVGFLWVVVFLTWSTPTWFYPQQRLGVDPAELLPFRVLGPLIRRLKGFWQG